MSATPKPLQLAGDMVNGPVNAPVAPLPKANAMSATPARAMILAAVVRFSTAAPHNTDRMLAAASRMIAAAAIQWMVESARPNSAAVYVAKITAIAPRAEG